MAQGKNGDRDVELTSAVTGDDVPRRAGGAEGSERSDGPGAEPARRGRPQRPKLEAKESAILELIGGKATVEQITRRLNVTADTVEGWMAQALRGVSNGLRYAGRSPREVELERELRGAKDALAQAMIMQRLYEVKQEMIEAKAKGFPLPRYGK